MHNLSLFDICCDSTLIDIRMYAYSSYFKIKHNYLDILNAKQWLEKNVSLERFWNTERLNLESSRQIESKQSCVQDIKKSIWLHYYYFLRRLIVWNGAKRRLHFNPHHNLEDMFLTWPWILWPAKQKQGGKELGLLRHSSLGDNLTLLFVLRHSKAKGYYKLL